MAMKHCDWFLKFALNFCIKTPPGISFKIYDEPTHKKIPRISFKIYNEPESHIRSLKIICSPR